MKLFAIFIFSFCLINIIAIGQNKMIIVAADGSGNFTTVQAAFNSIPVSNKTLITLFIKKGIYKEKLLLDSSKNFIELIGEDKFNTIITFDDHTGKIAPDGKFDSKCI